MKTTVLNPVKAFTLIALGLAIAAMGLYGASADDAPGAAVVGTLLMVIGVVLGVRAARGRLPVWAARTALAGGVVVAAFTASLIHAAVVNAPLFPRPQDVPSAIDSLPAPQHAATVERAREIVRAAVLAQNLPGVSVAVGTGGTVVWAEGFGWRDIVTKTPVTAATRFNIGTAASAVTGSVGPLGLTNTGTDSTADWSPSHNGEPEDDFPPFTVIRHVVFRLRGLPPEQPLPGDRATFYVPRSGDDPGTGRWPIYMRDLACCPNGRSFYSTPSDLVRFAMATNPANIDGELAGGTVMSLIANRDSGIVVAVASNITHANTSSVAMRIGDAFAQQAR